MTKDDKIIIRVDSDKKKFLKGYAMRKGTTVSKIFRDWIDWLINREKNENRRDEKNSSNRED